MAPSPLNGLATDIAQQANLEGRVLWMDATANLQRLSTRDGISAVFEKCRKANINTVVVDVKPLSGHVLWPSQVAPPLKEWRGFQYPEGHDLLLTAMLEGRRRGIPGRNGCSRCHASLPQLAWASALSAAFARS